MPDGYKPVPLCTMIAVVTVNNPKFHHHDVAIRWRGRTAVRYVGAARRRAGSLCAARDDRPLRQNAQDAAPARPQADPTLLKAHDSAFAPGRMARVAADQWNAAQNSRICLAIVVQQKKKRLSKNERFSKR